MLHYAIHAFLSEHFDIELNDFDTFVYANLFLAPMEDTWMGLVDPNIYVGLPGRGLTVPTNSDR